MNYLHSLLIFAGIGLSLFIIYDFFSCKEAVAKSNSSEEDLPETLWQRNIDEIIPTYAKAVTDIHVVADSMIRANNGDMPVEAWVVLTRNCQQAKDIANLVLIGELHETIDKKEFSKIDIDPQQYLRSFKQIIAYFINANRDAEPFLKQAKEAYKKFTLEPELQLGLVTEMFFSFSPYTSNDETNKQIEKALESIHEVMRIELIALITLNESQRATIIEGIIVPMHVANVVNHLIATHAITTTEEMRYWARFLVAPLSFGMINAIVEIMEQFNEDRFKKFDELPQEEQNTFKIIAIAEGETIGKLEYLPVECPVSEEQMKELFENWKKSREQATKSNEQ